MSEIPRYEQSEAEAEAARMQELMQSSEAATYGEAADKLGSSDLLEKHEVKEKAPRPLTYEDILHNPDIQRKVYEQLTQKKSSQMYNETTRSYEPYEYIDTESLIDFGEGIEPTNLKMIRFLATYRTGLRSGWQFHDSSPVYVEDYLRFLHEDPAKAQELLDSRNPNLQKAMEVLARGFDLSTIIPGAPSQIMKPFEERTRASSQDSDKLNYLDLDDKRNSVKKEKLKERIKDNTLIDLGAGSHGVGIDFALELGAKNVVEVEPYNIDRLLHAVQRHTAIDFNEEHTGERNAYSSLEKIHIENTDVLTFLECMPTNVEGVVFLLSGIDYFIIAGADYSRTEDYDKGEMYVKDVIKELQRVVGKSSSVVFQDSLPFFEQVRDAPDHLGFQVVHMDTEATELAILEK